VPRLLALRRSSPPMASKVPSTMRAVVARGQGRAGDFSQVAVVPDHPVPRPGRGQVLIRAVASSVNPIDWKLLKMFPLSYPKVLGMDVAGVVAEVGSGCERLHVGDEVWADLGNTLASGDLQLGAYGEYAVADESQVSLKPQSLDFQEAAALPLVGLTSFQALRMVGAPWTGRQGLTVVVTSGAGGTGLVAVQLAKAWGAEQIIAAASEKNAPLLRSLGATRVVDHHKESLWDVLPADSVDVIYDNLGAAGTADAAMAALRPGGKYIFLPGNGGAVSRRPKPGVEQLDYGMCDSSRGEDLDELRALVEAGHLQALVSKTFPLDAIAEAFSASVGGRVVGKIGVQLAAPQHPPEVLGAGRAPSRDAA